MRTTSTVEDVATAEPIEQARLRCFVAVTVGERITAPVAAAVAELQAVARADALRLSWVRPEGWHVTLEFLGDITAEQVERVRSILPAAFAVMPVLSVVARGLFTLPEKRTPRVVAMGFRDDAGLASLAAAVEAALESIDLECERRGFVSHMTVARIRDPEALLQIGRWKRFGALVEAMREREFGRDEIGSAGLFHSRLDPGGSRYERIANFPFAAG